MSQGGGWHSGTDCGHYSCLPPSGADPQLLANAGPDQSLVIPDPGQEANVALDGSGSVGDIAAYIWTESGTYLAYAQKPHVLLGQGTHDITLTVIDEQGRAATDVVRVTVAVDSTGDDVVDDNDTRPKTAEGDSADLAGDSRCQLDDDNDGVDDCNDVCPGVPGSCPNGCPPGPAGVCGSTGCGLIGLSLLGMWLGNRRRR